MPREGQSQRGVQALREKMCRALMKGAWCRGVSRGETDSDDGVLGESSEI